MVPVDRKYAKEHATGAALSFGGFVRSAMEGLAEGLEMQGRVLAESNDAECLTFNVDG